MRFDLSMSILTTLGACSSSSWAMASTSSATVLQGAHQSAVKSMEARGASLRGDFLLEVTSPTTGTRHEALSSRNRGSSARRRAPPIRLGQRACWLWARRPARGALARSRGRCAPERGSKASRSASATKATSRRRCSSEQSPGKRTRRRCSGSGRPRRGSRPGRDVGGRAHWRGTHPCRVASSRTTDATPERIRLTNTGSASAFRYVA